MSSPNWPTPSSDDVRAGLVASLTDVGERSVFGFVEPVDAERFGELEAAASAWWCAEVTFGGAFAGSVRCAMPDGLAADLRGAFLGDATMADASDGTVADLLGELTNMICGSWLTHAWPRESFHLAPPQVSRMPARWRPAGDAGPTPIFAVLDERPVAVWVTR